MSDEVRVTATRFYPVDGHSPVYLTVTVGNAQIGSTVVTWGGKVEDPSSEISHEQIGAAGDDLRSKLLVCNTIVKDVNATTNATSVRYVLEGGNATQTFDFEAEVAENGGFATYAITFAFI